MEQPVENNLTAIIEERLQNKYFFSESFSKKY
jgi:hypothetical protein